MTLLIIKEYICIISTQEHTFVLPAQKQRFIDLDVPGSQCAYHPLVCRRRTRGDQAGTYGRGILRKRLLKSLQSSEKRLEGPTAQRTLGTLTLAPGKSIQPFCFVDSLRLIRKQNRIAVKCET